MSNHQIKVNYGIDAPGVIRNFFLIGVTIAIAGWFCFGIKIPLIGYVLCAVGLVPIEPGGIRTDFGTRSMEAVLKPPYDVMANRMLKMYEDRGNKLPGPEGVARTIFKAATDRSGKLRYPIHDWPYLTMRQVLPDFLWRRLLGFVVDPPAE
jgi:hypothetical protein